MIKTIAKFSPVKGYEGQNQKTRKMVGCMWTVGNGKKHATCNSKCTAVYCSFFKKSMCIQFETEYLVIHTFYCLHLIFYDWWFLMHISDNRKHKEIKRFYWILFNILFSMPWILVLRVCNKICTSESQEGRGNSYWGRESFAVM